MAMISGGKKKEWGSLILFILICLGVGFLGAAITAKEIPVWYDALKKPLGNPPNWVFGPVWTLLYLLMAGSVWRIWCLRARTAVKRELLMFGIQLALNGLWSPVFFGLKKPGLALFVLLCLWRMIFGTQRAFRKLDPAAANLLWPYLAWVTYAAYLNAGIWWLNQ